jgi:hypothetical protein
VSGLSRVRALAARAGRRPSARAFAAARRGTRSGSRERRGRRGRHRHGRPNGRLQRSARSREHGRRGAVRVGRRGHEHARRRLAARGRPARREARRRLPAGRGRWRELRGARRQRRSCAASRAPSPCRALRHDAAAGRRPPSAGHAARISSRCRYGLRRGALAGAPAGSRAPSPRHTDAQPCRAGEPRVRPRAGQHECCSRAERVRLGNRAELRGRAECIGRVGPGRRRRDRRRVKLGLGKRGERRRGCLARRPGCTARVRAGLTGTTTAAAVSRHLRAGVSRAERPSSAARARADCPWGAACPWRSHATGRAAPRRCPPSPGRPDEGAGRGLAPHLA